MNSWAERLALGHVATASVIGGAGITGALGSWWMPVTVAAAACALLAAAVAFQARRRGAGLSRLARALDPRAWDQPAATA